MKSPFQRWRFQADILKNPQYPDCVTQIKIERLEAARNWEIFCLKMGWNTEMKQLIEWPRNTNSSATNSMVRLKAWSPSGQLDLEAKQPFFHGISMSKSFFPWDFPSDFSENEVEVPEVSLKMTTKSAAGSSKSHYTQPDKLAIAFHVNFFVWYFGGHARNPCVIRLASS